AHGERGGPGGGPQAGGEAHGGGRGGDPRCSCRAVARAARSAAGRWAVGGGGAARVRRASILACDVAWLDVATRIERRLQDLAARFGRPVPGGTSIPITLRQDDLAALAGTSRETANRALRRLVERGRAQVERRGRYVVRSPLRLLRP